MNRTQLLAFLAAVALVSLCYFATGCKSTEAVHTWPDGSHTRIKDVRFATKSEARFSFRRETNGTVEVNGQVASGTDSKILEETYRLGVKAGKLAL